VAALLALALALATGAAFWPASSAGLCLFDDTAFLIDASGWRASNPDWLSWIFSGMVNGHYQPLTYLSYALEERLFGIVPPDMNDVTTDRDTTSQGYHVTNIVIHSLNAVLVYAVALRVMRLAARSSPTSPVPVATGIMHTAAVTGALLWGINPLRVESVAWVTERRDVLSAFFLLSATILYLHWGANPVKARARWYIATILALVLSLLSKAWGMSFFVLAILLDVYPLRRLPLWPWQWFPRVAMKPLLEKAPLIALGILFAAIAAKAQASSPFTVSTLEKWGVDDRISQALFGVVFYLRKTLWPTSLSAIYELPRNAPITETRFLLSAVVAIISAAAILILARKRPGLAVAFAAYLVLVAPVLGLFQSGIQLVAERYAYLSLIPLFIACAVVFSRALSTQRTAANARAIAWVALFGIACFWSVLTWRQSYLWHNTRYLWKDALESGHDGVMLRCFYANHLYRDKEPEEAEVHFRKAAEIDPTYGDTWMGLASIELDRKDWPAARDHLLKASTDPVARLKAEVRLGLIYMNEAQLNDPQQALSHFENAVHTMETIGKAAIVGRPYLHLGMTYGILGDDANAVKWLKKAARFRDSKTEAEQFLKDIASGR
jgi:tetratricopeptide (TPR) repeat protein